MANPLPQNSTSPTPLRCFIGALISGGIASLLYSFTKSIINVFAHKAVPMGNPTTTNIAVAVRTLVMGMSVLATAIFAISAVGLVALGIQILVQSLQQKTSGDGQ